MRKKLFAVLALGTLLLPLGVQGVRANSDNNHNSAEITSMQLAQNQPNPDNKERGRKRGRRGGMRRILSKLDLTTEQTQQIEAIQAKYQGESEPLHQNLKSEISAMRSLFGSDATTQELQEQRQKVRNLETQLADIRFSQMLEVREILTQEQRDRMAELIAKKGRGRLPETTSSVR